MTRWTARFDPRAALTLLGLVLGAGDGLADTATYQLTFTATWSAETHPQDFPSNAHFSPLVGGVHGDEVTFWQEGEPATLGMQRMAEWGDTTPLDTEVQTAIDAGQALAIVIGEGLPNSPDETSVEFTANDTFSRLTLVAMVAPSPDWFAGVSGLELRPEGAWVDGIVVDLYPFDAGTDAGITYTAPDQVEVPHVPIAPITGEPFTPGVPVGTFTLTLLTTTDVPEPASLALSASPNPFNPATTVSYGAATAGRLTLTVHDLRGARVATLLDTDVAAGPGAVHWDGRDVWGRSAAAGTYVLRLRDASGIVATRKITLVE